MQNKKSTPSLIRKSTRYNLSKVRLIISLIFCMICLSSAAHAKISDTKILDDLEDLLRHQSKLLTDFDYLLHKTPTDISERKYFMDGFEDLVRRQAILLSQFEDLLSAHWDEMSIEEQEKFLDSFSDLNRREAILVSNFKALCEENWPSFSPDVKAKFLASLEDLSKRLADLISKFEELFKRKNGGLSIKLFTSEQVIQKGESMTYNYSIANLYKINNLINILIVDETLGTIVDNISLAPGERKFFIKTVSLSQSTCTRARAMGNVVDVKLLNEENSGITNDSEDEIVSVESNTVCVLVREPVESGQFCEYQNVIGTGKIEVSTSIKEKRLALDYQNIYAGDGTVELDSENTFSESASEIMRPVGNDTRPLNFFESTTMNYVGVIPLVGRKTLISKEFWNGLGVEVKEEFSINKMEKKQTTYFASMDPTYLIQNYTIAKRMNNISTASSAYLAGLDTSILFDGTWESDAEWHESLKKELRVEQKYNGTFEVKKRIQFNKNLSPEERMGFCEGLDC